MLISPRHQKHGIIHSCFNCKRQKLNFISWRSFNIIWVRLKHCGLFFGFHVRSLIRLNCKVMVKIIAAFSCHQKRLAAPAKSSSSSSPSPTSTKTSTTDTDISKKGDSELEVEEEFPFKYLRPQIGHNIESRQRLWWPWEIRETKKDGGYCVVTWLLEGAIKKATKNAIVEVYRFKGNYVR